MTDRTRFLKEETLAGHNKIARAPLPPLSVAEEEGSLPIRKAKALALMLEKMPLFIGKGELIVGTRTWYTPHAGNEDGHDHFQYYLGAYPRFVRQEEIDHFGGDFSGYNECHYTPDLGILLSRGVGGIIRDAEERKKDVSLSEAQIDFLDSVIIAYRGLSTLIGRYAAYADELAAAADEESEVVRLREIGATCRAITLARPSSFRQAVQLLWLGHLVTMIESFLFICYGRLDVILTPFLGDTPREEAEELLECLLLKMYDQADIQDGSYINKHEGQLVITLGGVLPNGENAVSEVTMLFLEAIDNIRLPEPEFNLRLSQKNPPDFLDRAAALTISGCNFIAYYNDDRFVEALASAGIPVEVAREYGFDLCQDMNIPGKADFFRYGEISLAHELMAVLEERQDYPDFDSLFAAYLSRLRRRISDIMAWNRAEEERMLLYRAERYDEFFALVKEQNAQPVFAGRSPMCPLPYLSGLFHGTIESATDMIYESYPIKHRGSFIGTSVEAINSLAAIARVVYEEKACSLADLVAACRADYAGEDGELLRRRLWAAPKWGNDEPLPDGIAKTLLESCMREFGSYETLGGGRVLTGIHQPHPVPSGAGLMATPDGRHAGKPVAVTMTPASGSMKNGPTAALKSASVLDPMLLQWNFCVMINYYASAFAQEGGRALFKQLLSVYFARGGMQHQPNVMDAEQLRAAQENPAAYKDLIVRMWGVSAHFVDLPREIQDELISRLG